MTHVEANLYECKFHALRCVVAPPVHRGQSQPHARQCHKPSCSYLESCKIRAKSPREQAKASVVTSSWAQH